MPLHLEGRLAATDRAASGPHCPIERTLEVVGTRSAMVLMREASYGTTRFDDFVRRTGLTEAVVAARLKELVLAGVLDRASYQEPGQRARSAYVLTAAGDDLLPTLLALASWGSTHLPRRGTPTFRHDGCGAEVTVQLACAAGHPVTADDLTASA